MLCDNAPIIKALRCSACETSFPKLKHILIGLVADSPPVIQKHLGVIIVKNAFDILSTDGVIGIALIKGSDFIFRSLQVRRCAENFTDCIIPAEKRQALVFVASVVVI